MTRKTKKLFLALSCVYAFLIYEQYNYWQSLYYADHKIQDTISLVKQTQNKFLILLVVFYLVILSNSILIIKYYKEKNSEEKNKLEEAIHTAQEATKVKQNFLANMSHEIRTPLNGIIGISQLLGETKLQEDQIKYVDMMESSGLLLLGIINDVLDFSMIESHKMVLENRNFNLKNLIQELLELFSKVAQKKDIKILFNFEFTEDVWINSDSLRITQILNNILSNALKFTSTGSIEITVKKNNVNEHGNVLFIIKDNGIGMSPDQIKNLFKPFEQADRSITRKYGGTGLGLVITKNMIDLFGGSIWLESTKDVGTTFYFSLNTPIVDQKMFVNEKIIHKINIHESYRVLIVDDNDINRVIAKGFLRKRFNLLFEAEDGQKAFDFYVKNKPHFIFMDLQMPNIDGYSATTLIREYELKNSLRPCLIVALTANVQAEEKKKALKSGFDFYLVKPIKQIILYTIVDIMIESYRLDK